MIKQLVFQRNGMRSGFLALWSILPLLLLESCAVPPPPEPKNIPFDEYMMLGEPKFIQDYSYLDLVLTHRLVPKLTGSIRFRPGAVDAKYNFGNWELTSVKQICVGKGAQFPVIHIVSNAVTANSVTASLLLSKEQLEMLLTKLQELKFNLSCSGI